MELTRQLDDNDCANIYRFRESSGRTVRRHIFVVNFGCKKTSTFGAIIIFRIDPVFDEARIAIVRSPSIEVCIQTAG